MGADIHGPWVQSKYGSETDPWWELVADSVGQRNYLTFALLGDVRNAFLGVEAPYAHRGYPDDDQCTPWREHGLDADCHSSSWVTTEEAVKVRDAYREEAEQHDYSADSWLDLLVAIMQHVESTGHKARAVFCFDN